MYILKNIIWFIFQPINFIILIIFIGYAIYYFKNKKIGFLTISFGFIFILFIGIFPIGSYIALPLEKRFSQPNLVSDPHGIIVLGGSEKTNISSITNQISLNKSSERLIYFIILSKKYPDSKLLFSGGGGKSYKEHDVAKNIFKELGLNTEKIYFEKLSQNTFENAKFSYDLISPKKNQTWLLITSAITMPRAVGTFRKIGWNVIPYPVDYQFTNRENFFKLNSSILAGLTSTNLVLYEWYGLILYRFLNRIDVFLPGQ